jgi:hypothetical protein
MPAPGGLALGCVGDDEGVEVGVVQPVPLLRTGSGEAGVVLLVPLQGERRLVLLLPAGSTGRLARCVPLP